MKRLKPDYDSEAVQGELVEKVCSYFGRVFDDKEQERHNKLRGHGKPTINETAAEFDITSHKVRKLLVTGGYYDTALFRNIKELKDQGMGIEEIGAELGLKPGTIRIYLPYERVIYNLPERSVNADRLQRFKKRHGGYKAKK